MCGEERAWVLDPEGRTRWHSTARVLIDHPDPGDVNPRRANLDAVLLPTGEVFVEGGAKNTRSDATGVKVAEMFDPQDSSGSPAGTWRVLPEAQEVRNYHSVALLMPSGAVWVAGSNFDSKTGLRNRNLWIEVFEPWYFCHRRPRIAASPERACHGDRLDIDTSEADHIEQVVLVRCGTCTHNFNPDQRLVELTIERESSGRLTAQVPDEMGVAIPGYYLLFVLDGDRVPSEGRFIQICARSGSRSAPSLPRWWDLIHDLRRYLPDRELGRLVRRLSEDLLTGPSLVTPPLVRTPERPVDKEPEEDDGQGGAARRVSVPGTGTFRQREGSDTWHFCQNCSNWPTEDFDERETKPTSDDLCNECRAKLKNKKCDR